MYGTVNKDEGHHHQVYCTSTTGCILQVWEKKMNYSEREIHIFSEMKYKKGNVFLPFISYVYRILSSYFTSQSIHSLMISSTKSARTTKFQWAREQRVVAKQSDETEKKEGWCFIRRRFVFVFGMVCIFWLIRWWAS